MKVFFTASMRGKRFFDKYYCKIYSFIEELGYKHLDKLLLEDSESSFYKELDKKGEKGHIEFYNKTITNLKAADINIFECSLSSLGIGYQVEKSLEFNKPTIVLYLNNHDPHFLLGRKDEKLLLRKYNEKNIKEIVKQTLEEARERSDKRFNFFISPKLINYLEEISKEQGITKSTFIRGLILDQMKKGI